MLGSTVTRSAPLEPLAVSRACRERLGVRAGGFSASVDWHEAAIYTLVPAAETDAVVSSQQPELHK